MWFCFNDAFVSVVQSTDPGILMVRARAYEHLSRLFPKTLIDPSTNAPYKIHITPENDYRYRVYCDRKVWATEVSARIFEIEYTNFKDSVKEDKLHKLYEDFWFLHMIYQNGKKWWKHRTRQWAAQTIAEKESKAGGDTGLTEDALDLLKRGSKR